MVRIFRSYHPAVIFFLLVYTFLFRAVLFIEPMQFNEPASSNYLGKAVYHLPGLMTNKPWVFHLIASLLVFSQAMYFNHIINRFRILSKLSYLPAMSYVLMSSAFIDFTYLSPALLANTFLLISLSKVFSVYKKERAMAPIFDAGLLISIASLFFFPYLVFFLFVIAALVVLRPLNFREYILAVLGLLIPYYFMGIYFFWNHKLPQFWESVRIEQLRFSLEQVELNLQVILVSVILLIILLWNFFFIQSNIFRMVVQVRSYLMVFILFFGSGIVSMLVHFTGELYHFVWLAIPFGLAFSIFFLESRRQWFSEVLHLFLTLTILFFEYHDLLK